MFKTAIKRMPFGKKKLPDSIGVCVVGKGRDTAETFDLKDYDVGTVG